MTWNQANSLCQLQVPWSYGLANSVFGWNAFSLKKTFRLVFLYFFFDLLKNITDENSRSESDWIYKMYMDIAKAYMEFIKSIFIETLQL